MISKDRWFLNKDRTKAHKENDPEARTLFAIPGAKIDDALATRLGILGENKSIDAAPANKAIKPETKEAPKVEKPKA